MSLLASRLLRWRFNSAAIVIAVFNWNAVFASGNEASSTEHDLPPSIVEFFADNCSDCHQGQAAEADFDVDDLTFKLDDRGNHAVWVRIFDRVNQHEMPPDGAEAWGRDTFLESLQKRLVEAHEHEKATVLRRLNRREYENTLNDLFGTNLDLEERLPPDGRSAEFDNIGDSLGVSLVHLEQYLQAAESVLDAAIAKTVEPTPPQIIEASYENSREAERFIGSAWKLLEDGAVVRFQEGGYPSGMIRGSNVRQQGKYRVRVRGYAYQTTEPITFSIGGTSFARGSEKPIYRYATFPPGEPGDCFEFEFETWIARNYMIEIEPYGLFDPDRNRRASIDECDRPGLAIIDVTLEGPLLDEFPSRGHRLIFAGLNRREVPPRNPADREKSWYEPVFEVASSDEAEDARQSLRRVAAAAFRRPVSEDEIAIYLELFQNQRDDGQSFEQALRTAITAILCSPKFLYLLEAGPTLDDYALATRLSYLLTRTAPDEELLRLAASEEITNQPEVLRQQTERLIQSDAFERFVIDFCDAWLDLRELDFTAPDASLFPEYDRYLRESMPMETRAFLRELIESNLPVRNLVASDFAMLNERLATLYEIEGVVGPDLSKVALPADSRRGGLLTQSAILKVTANGTNTSPVVRGAWVLERLLAITPPPPPPGIPGVEPDVRGATTIREQLDLHRNSTNCNACHRQIDPPGFALEEFDPIGQLRTQYRTIENGERVDRMLRGRRVRYRLGPPIDSSGQFATGETFSDFLSFRDQLASDQRLLARAFVVKLATFATGREMGFSDREPIDAIVAAAEAQGFGVRDLIHLVIQSDLFRSK